MPTSSTRADRTRIHGAEPLPAAGPGGAVALWWLDLTEPTDLSVLDDDDRERCAALPSRTGAQRLATARALTRQVLASLVDTDPARLPLDRTCARCGRAHGRPRLVDSRVLELSSSRSGDRGILAVGGPDAVGVDLERLRPVAAPARTAGAVLSRHVRAEVERAGPAGGAVLLRHWVRHEAVVKACGDGLPAAHHRFRVLTDPAPTHRVVDGVAGAGVAPGWWLDDVAVEPGWVAALAVRAAGPSQYSPAS